MTDKLEREIERLTMENEALVERNLTLEERIRALENDVESLMGKIWRLESEYALEIDLTQTLRINEIDPWMINHETISQKIEKRILAKLRDGE